MSASTANSQGGDAAGNAPAPMGRIFVVVLVLLLVVAAVGWFVWLPQWRPALRDGEAYGVDVSQRQGDIKWSAVARDGISFAYIKATEGGDRTDDRFATNWAEARAAGVRTGAYHFFSLCTDAGVQAQHFLRVAPPQPDALPPAIYLEIVNSCSRRPEQEAHQQVENFARTVEDAWNQPVVLYASNDFNYAYRARQALDRPLWIPSFPQRPRGEWTVWQLHGFAKVAGVPGRVNLGVAHMPPLWTTGIGMIRSPAAA